MATATTMMSPQLDDNRDKNSTSVTTGTGTSSSSSKVIINNIIRIISILAVICSFAVITVCGFVDIQWDDEYYNEHIGIESYVEENSYHTTSGILMCKYFGLQGYFGPKNLMDTISSLSGLLSFIIGVIGVIVSTCCCCCCTANSNGHPKGNWSTPQHPITPILFGICTILQPLTFLVLISPACTKEYDGECTLLPTGYISIGACFLYLFSFVLSLRESRHARFSNDKNNKGNEQQEGPNTKDIDVES